MAASCDPISASLAHFSQALDASKVYLRRTGSRHIQLFGLNSTISLEDLRRKTIKWLEKAPIPEYSLGLVQRIESRLEYLRRTSDFEYLR